MGLSIAITGGIVVFAIVYAMMSFPAIMDNTTKVSISSTKMVNTLNSILHTQINISNLRNISNNTVTFSVNNTGSTTLWDYKKFDMIITYRASDNSKPTEVLQYATSCASLAADNWCIASITNDLSHPGMLDPKEKANIQAQLSTTTRVGGTLTLNLATNNGILATNSVIIT